MTHWCFRVLCTLTHKRKSGILNMGYQADKDKQTNASNNPDQWIRFPDEEKNEENPYSNFEYWDDEMNKQADDLLHVSRLDGVVRQGMQSCEKEIERRERVKNQKPLPIWARVLLHQPTTKTQSALYVIGFGSLLIGSIVLFNYALDMIL